MLACMWFAFVYITSRTVKSEDELEGRYGIKTIGSARDAGSVSVAAASIRALMKDEKDILLISSLGHEVCERLAGEIKSKYPNINTIVAGNIVKDAAGVIPCQVHAGQCFLRGQIFQRMRIYRMT